MYESYSLAIAESSVKQNLENRLKIIDSLCLGAIWELWGLGQREAGLQGLRASRRQGWSLGHPEQGALPRGVGLPWRLSSKKSTCSTRDAGSISELRRCPGSRNGNPSPYSCLKNRVDREAWQATGYVVTESQTQLKRLSSSYHQKRHQTVNGTTHLKNTEACLQPFLSHISEPWTAFRKAREHRTQLEWGVNGWVLDNLKSDIEVSHTQKKKQVKSRWIWTLYTYYVFSPWGGKEQGVMGVASFRT